MILIDSVLILLLQKTYKADSQTGKWRSLTTFIKRGFVPETTTSLFQLMRTAASGDTA
ncbi:hypothetical protein YC2023_041949 [Brassica napus]|uniref:(rape) hypothetical protein n=1 Tax=Brassica napus TaxID=3708 RepID=A0A816IMZ9_BRANA|nr:unnamed protein product [Brassica napus]